MSYSDDTMKFEVGDELAFRNFNLCSCPYSTYEITKITPTGIIKCGPYQINPDLTIRGKFSPTGPFRGQPVTPEIIQKIRLHDAVAVLQNVAIEKLSDDDIMKFADMISRSYTYATDSDKDK